MGGWEYGGEEQLEERVSGVVLVSVSISIYSVIYEIGINVNYLHRAILARSHLTRRGDSYERSYFHGFAGSN